MGRGAGLHSNQARWRRRAEAPATLYPASFVKPVNLKSMFGKIKPDSAMLMWTAASNAAASTTATLWHFDGGGQLPSTPSIFGLALCHIASSANTWSRGGVNRRPLRAWTKRKWAQPPERTVRKATRLPCPQAPGPGRPAIAWAMADLTLHSPWRAQTGPGYRTAANHHPLGPSCSGALLRPVGPDAVRFVAIRRWSARIVRRLRWFPQPAFKIAHTAAKSSVPALQILHPRCETKDQPVLLRDGQFAEVQSLIDPVHETADSSTT